MTVESSVFLVLTEDITEWVGYDFEIPPTFTVNLSIGIPKQASQKKVDEIGHPQP